MTLHSGGSSGEYSFHQSLAREQGEEKNAVQGCYFSCKTCKTSKLLTVTTKLLPDFLRLFASSFQRCGIV